MESLRFRPKSDQAPAVSLRNSGRRKKRVPCLATAACTTVHPTQRRTRVELEREVFRNSFGWQAKRCVPSAVPTLYGKYEILIESAEKNGEKGWGSGRWMPE